MEEIVEEAIESSSPLCPDDQSCLTDPDEFLPPSCAVIGCGASGIDWLQHVHSKHPTIALSSQTTIESRDCQPDTQIEVPESPPRQKSLEIKPAVIDQALDFPLEQLDIITVILELNDPRDGRLAASVCRSLADDQTVLAIPAIPQEGLSEETTIAFSNLVNAAGTTIPYDTSRIIDAFEDVFPTETRQQVLNTTGRLMSEWISDIFEAFQDPLTVPLDLQDGFSHLQDGGVALLYWGWGSREDIPEVLLKHAGAHRVCDGNRMSADGGFGFLRFGEPFTKADFESIQAHTEQLLRPDRVPPNRWQMAGKCSFGLDENCRFALLLTGIDVKSLPFLNNTCIK